MSKKVARKKTGPAWIILGICVGVLLLGGVLVTINNSGKPAAPIPIQTAYLLPTPGSDCNDPLPTGAVRDIKGNNKRVHWTGCYVSVKGNAGFAKISSDADGWTISVIFIPVEQPANLVADVWEKELFGNAYSFLYGPIDDATVYDGLAILYLEPQRQKDMGYTYPAFNSIFGNQYVQWVPKEGDHTYDCRIFVAIHIMSLQGKLGGNNKGIAKYFEPGQPLAQCRQFLN